MPKVALAPLQQAEDIPHPILGGGLVTLIEDQETTLLSGDCAAWPAGQPIAHCLENRTAADVRYLVIGSRNMRDTIHYPDHDLITQKDGAIRHHTHANGTPRIAGDRK